MNGPKTNPPTITVKLINKYYNEIMVEYSPEQSKSNQHYRFLPLMAAVELAEELAEQYNTTYTVEQDNTLDNLL